MTKKGVMRMTVVVSMMMGTTFIAHAKPERDGSARRGGLELERRVSQLETQNDRLQKRIRNINQRLKDVEDYLEGGNGGGQLPGGGARLGVACMLKDSAGGAHTGMASTQLDAEYAANKACFANTYSSRCNAGKMTCEPVTSYSSSVCVLKDSAGQVHRGEGDNEVLATAASIKQCMKSTYSSRCNAGSVRCEAVY